MKLRWNIWFVSASLAALLHAAAAAAFLIASPPEAADDDGAPGIEVGIELAAPRDEPTDLPPGSPADDAAPSSAAAAQETKPQPTENLSQETPVEAPEPDRVVAPEKPKEQPPEPKEVVETPARERSQQSAESLPSEAAAAPSVETAKEAPVSTAPTPGSGASAQRIKTTWQRQLLGHLNRNKRYPNGAGRREAEIVVTFTLDRRGKLLDAKVARSSGDARFDEAALAMLRRADPLPMPPPLVADNGLTFTLPVSFTLGGRS